MPRPAPAATVSSHPQLPSLTPLRGLAALWVVLYHYTTRYCPSLQSAFGGEIVAKGYLAVDLFFLLSGFVLTHVYHQSLSGRGSGNYRKFLGARIARLYPVHLLTLMLLVAAVAGSALLREAFGRHALSIAWQGPRSVEALIANLFMLQGLKGSALGWNYPAWSVSLEFIAYLFFPFVLFIVCRGPSWAKASLAVAAILALACLTVLTGDSFSQWDGALALLRCLPEFILGTTLYALFRSNALRAVAKRDTVAILLLLITVGLLSFGVLDFAVVLLMGLLVVAMTANDGTLRWLINLAPFVWLGEISYSLYLGQSLVEFLTTRLLMAMGIGRQEFLPVSYAVLLIGGMLVLSLAFAAFTYTTVEVPWRARLRRCFERGGGYSADKACAAVGGS